VSSYAETANQTVAARFDILDRTAGANNDVLLLIGRVILAVMFVISGWGKLGNIDGFAGYLTGRLGLPAGYPLAVLAAVVEFFGAVAVLAGVKTRWAALSLAVFTLIAALLAHRYWTFPADQVTNQYNHFMKNITIIGGLLVLFVAGPGRLSIDRFFGWSRADKA
jgi:putative oxidoreductase